MKYLRYLNAYFNRKKALIKKSSISGRRSWILDKQSKLLKIQYIRAEVLNPGQTTKWSMSSWTDKMSLLIMNNPWNPWNPCNIHRMNCLNCFGSFYSMLRVDVGPLVLFFSFFMFLSMYLQLKEGMIRNDYNSHGCMFKDFNWFRTWVIKKTNKKTLNQSAWYCIQTFKSIIIWIDLIKHIL